MDGDQTYVERLPMPALAGRVRTVWIQRIGPQPYPQRNLPTGGVELHCPIGGLPRLVGPLTAASVGVLAPYTTVVGARFWPGAAWPMVGPPAGELVDLTVQLDELWAGTTAAQLGELLAEAADPDAALDLLQRYLVREQLRADSRNPLVAEAVRRLMPWQPVEIGQLTTHLSISESQLRRRFLATVGMGPKALQRTLRFQGYLALAQAGWAAKSPARAGLADVAAAVGYADHAHLTRECRRLSGLTPRELLGGREDRCGCGHDHTASYQPFLASQSTRPLSA